MSGTFKTGIALKFFLLDLLQSKMYTSMSQAGLPGDLEYQAWWHRSLRDMLQQLFEDVAWSYIVFLILTLAAAI